MKEKRLRRLLYPKIAISVLIVLTVSITFAAISSRRFVLQQGIRNLSETATLLKNVLVIADLSPTHPDHAELIQDHFSRIAEGTNTRISIVLRNGLVVVDTDENPSIMDNHRDRPEILRALSGIPSSNLRFSSTVKLDLLYYAVPLFAASATDRETSSEALPEQDRGEAVAVLRVAMPYLVVQEQLVAIILYLLVGSSIFIGLSFFLIVYIDRQIERPLAILAEEAVEYTGYEFGRDRPIATSSLEIQRLYRSIKHMARQLKRQYDDIARQKKELQAVLDSMDNGVLVLDSHGEIIRTNPAARTLFSSSGQDLIGKYYLQAVPSRQLNSMLEPLIREPDNASLLSSERFEVNLGERSFQVSLSVVTLKPERTILAVFNDITRLLHLEKVRRDFVANVSHELKTPVTSIKGFTETLLYQGLTPDDPHFKKFLTIIHTQTDRLQAIIEDLLTLSLLEQDEATQGFQLVHVGTLIKDSIKICIEKPPFSSRTVTILSDEPIQIACNPLLVEQALINLIENALKYSEQHAKVEISYRKTDDNVKISVTDTGWGIPRELIPRIFERFFRIDKGRSREKGGTGLGLAIVRHIMLRHNGSVHVDSTEGKGSVFTLSFPGSS